MKILKSTIPYVIAFSPDDINYLHMSCHCYKDLLKKSKTMPKAKRRERLSYLNEMLTLIDLMM